MQNNFEFICELMHKCANLYCNKLQTMSQRPRTTFEYENSELHTRFRKAVAYDKNNTTMSKVLNKLITEYCEESEEERKKLQEAA